MTLPSIPATLALKRIHFFRPGVTVDDPLRPILADVSWTVRPGEVAAILGANGCGKSTLLRIASGYLWPQKGAVDLLGHTLGDVPLAPLRARIGIVEATTVYPFDDTMTAQDVVVSGYYSSLTLGYAHPADDQFAHARHLLEQVGLPTKHDQLYATLSTGERLRTLLARALVRTPDLLLLDEPTAGLDLPSRESLLATLARLHRRSAAAGLAPAMITVTHHLEELLPDTSNVLLLSRRGTVVASGPPAAVLTDEHLSAAYSVPIHVACHHGRYAAHVNPAVWDDLLTP
jgi:iron complex transport system ATP-binding protein